MGMPPANEVARVGVVVLPGSKASELLHPTRPRRAIANRGARKRAIRRESLKVYVTTTSSGRGVRALNCERVIWGERPGAGHRNCTCLQDMGRQGGCLRRPARIL